MRLQKTIFALWILMATLTACQNNVVCPEQNSPNISFKPGEAGERWLAMPFPLDNRDDVSDKEWDLYPNPFNVGLVDDYIKVVTRDIDGFSLNGAVYFELSETLDTSGLPAAHASAPHESLTLVDIDPDSPEYGRSYPVRWEYWAQSTSYVPANTLAVAPHWGFPLQESTTYAIILKSGLQTTNAQPLQADAALGALLSSAGATGCGQSMPSSTYERLDNSFSKLRLYLQDQAIDPATVVGASVFTTQATTSQLKSIYEQVQQAPAPSYRPDDWQAMTDAGELFEAKSFKWTSNETTEFYLMEGKITVPNYQVGDVPYNRDGELQFTDGVPSVVRDEDIRFTLSIPKTQPVGSDGCFPITEYAHGTGGSAYSMVSETAGRLAARGIAAIGIDMPLHGPRSEGNSFDVNIASFNFVNPDAARSMFRQAAIDTWALTQFVTNNLEVDEASSPTGEPICFSTDKVGFFGHSQGGISGAIALAFDEDISSWVLSGAGGGLSITVLERKDPVDFEELIRFFTELPETETLSELHPLITLIQTAVDITDPINYAPSWNPRRESPAPNILVTSGCYDEQTPHFSASAMAVAGRIPLVEPAAMETQLYSLANLPYISAPVRSNLEGSNTGGFLQWCGSILQPSQSNHFVVFNRPEAIHATMEFLHTGLQSNQAIIERKPGADVR
ncbi:MAG: hypothetical protein HOK28_05395 [Deltaproteobacteria bacterium]|nr:hypothetical protein [Deltaproteobacteria bacterium]